MTRQREWQLKQVAAGNCQTCGKPRDGASKLYCAAHRKSYNEGQKARYRRRRAAAGKKERTVPIESWRTVWRAGVAPQLSVEGLEALARALANDDPRLWQGQTAGPTPGPGKRGWDPPCEGACLIGYAGWQGEGLETVAEVQDFFAQACYRADLALGEPAGCRWFLNWFDETPREVMRRLLLAEVRLALDGRGGTAPSPAGLALPDGEG
jgi:hypothetical protein